MSCSLRVYPKVEQTFRVGSRASALAKAQVHEVLEAIRYFDKKISFDPIWIETTGDADQKTLLKSLGKTDFFTKEIDERLLKGEIRISIHSAKDLPQEIPEGLSLIAITAGQDPRETLVGSLFPGARIGVSSERREKFLETFQMNLKPIQIRGTIEERLSLIEKGLIDALVVPEAALIRLKLNPPRLYLNWPVTPLQGQLALLARQDDQEMKELFSASDVRKKTAYFGLDPKHHPKKQFLTHCPLIRIKELSPEKFQALWKQFFEYTALLVTSQTTVSWLIRGAQKFGCLELLKKKKALCVGQKTAEKLRALGVECLVADDERAEGLLPYLDRLRGEKWLYLHSAKSRALIKNYLIQERFDFCALIIYDTLYDQAALSHDLEGFDDFFFTSPSTVEAFFSRYKALPKGKTVRAIGPITEEALCHNINSRT